MSFLLKIFVVMASEKGAMSDDEVADQQMKEMMGFASFGSAPKRQRRDLGSDTNAMTSYGKLIVGRKVLSSSHRCFPSTPTRQCI